MADRDTVRALLEHAGTTYADEAGIGLRDTPAPLYQLSVLTLLLSARIRASVGVAATRELIAAGYATPEAMLAAGWQDRVDALGRGGYRRYDERTATQLGEGARLVTDSYGGDLRRLRRAADGDPSRVRALLQEFTGIGAVGADIFCREVQGLWTELRPTLDARARDAAGTLGLPRDPATLAGLVAGEDLPRLAAALVRVALDDDLAVAVRDAAG